MIRDIIILLRNLLAGLYLEATSIQRIVQDAGIDPARIIFGSTAVTMWESVLAEAVKGNKIGNLLDVVYAEYPSNPDFQKFYDTYHKSIDQPAKGKILEPLESIFEDTLEHMTWERWPALLCAWPEIDYSREFFPENQQGLLNPFQAMQAEEDRFLLAVSERLSVERQLSTHLPLWARPMLNLQNTMLLGHSGTGKTATSLIIARELLRTHSDVLPIYWSCPITLTEIHEQLLSLGNAMGYTLVGYLSQNPKEYFETQPLYQRAIAVLLSSCFGTDDTLAHVFEQTQLRRHPNLGDLLTDLSKQATNVDLQQIKPTSSNQHLFLRHIENAQLTSINTRIVLLDVQAHLPLEQSSKFSESILQTITMLSRAGLTIKAFLPFEPPRQLEQRFQQIIQSQWSRQETTRIFHDRLLIVDDTVEGHLGTLCDPRSVNIATTEERILDASNHIPGHLMHVGNLFVRSYHEKGSLLHQTDVEHIFETLAKIRSRYRYE